MLAPTRIVSLVCKIACMTDVDMALPVRVQYCNEIGGWSDFGFIDQLEIISRICGCNSALLQGAAIRGVRFPVLDGEGEGGDCIFSIRSVGSGEIRLSLVFRADGSESDVRIVGFGDFYRDCRLSFVAGTTLVQ